MNLRYHVLICGVLILIRKGLVNLNSLTPDAQRILNEPNAGGSSKYSEALAMEILVRYFDLRCWKTEMEVEYLWENWKRCDFLVKEISGHVIGVSITRALIPSRHSYESSKEYLQFFLNRKIQDLIISRSGTIPSYSYLCLMIWSPNSEITQVLMQIYQSIQQWVYLVIMEAGEEDIRTDFHHRSSEIELTLFQNLHLKCPLPS